MRPANQWTLRPLRDRTKSWILRDLTRMLDARMRLDRAEVEWRRALEEGGHGKTTVECRRGI